MKWVLIVFGVLVAALVALALITTKTSKSGSGSTAPTAKNIRANINQIRNHAHLKPLKNDPAAALLADAHSTGMAGSGRLTAVPRKDLEPFLGNGHNGDVYQVVESVSGPLPSAGQLVSDMMSAQHGRARRRGFLNPHHNRIGIGIDRRGSTLWATAIFIAAK